MKKVGISKKEARIVCRDIAARNGGLSPDDLAVQFGREAVQLGYEGNSLKRFNAAANVEIEARRTLVALGNGESLCTVWGCGRLARFRGSPSQGSAMLCNFHLGPAAA